MSFRTLNPVGFLLAIVACAVARGATYTVTNTLDAGEGTLRQALLDANANVGPDRIVFGIPGDGIHEIPLKSDLPDVSETVEIDGSTQPGYSGTPLVALKPARVSGTSETRGLHLTGTGITIRALGIHSFYSDGSRVIEPGEGLVISGPGNNRILGCMVGLSPDGVVTSSFPGFINRGVGIRIDQSPNNVIGGIGPNEGNTICSYSIERAAVLVEGSASTGNQILGNRINMNRNATQLASYIGRGIVVSNAPSNTIGGLDPAARNYIYGDDTGLQISDGGSRSNLVLGNWIGLKADGTQIRSAADSPTTGIRIGGRDNLVGGTQPEARNVVAGGGSGIILSGDNNRVLGNYIGVDPKGNAAVRNSTGVFVTGSGNWIGGSEVGAGNLISGNGTGASLRGSSNIFQGNWVGLDASGLLAIPNGRINSGDSSVVVLGTHNLIGGTSSGARNVIAGNDSAGVDLLGTSSQFNRVEGNWIGLAADGASPLPNRHRGIQILGASHSTIGGESPGAGNEIANSTSAFYSGEGVFVGFTFGGFGSAGTNNLIQGNHIHHNAANGIGMLAGATVLGNSIHDNGQLAIDRGLDGVTKNAPNGQHNFPVLTSARQGSTDIEGTFNGARDTDYLIQFYNNEEVNQGGYGEMKRHIGDTVVHTDAQGKASYRVHLDTTSPAKSWVTATATPLLMVDGVSSAGETSEAALNQLVGAPIVQHTANLSIHLESPATSVSETNSFVVRLSVANFGPDASEAFTLMFLEPRGWEVIDHVDPPGASVALSPRSTTTRAWLISFTRLDLLERKEIEFTLKPTALGSEVKVSALVLHAALPDPDHVNNHASLTVPVRISQPVSVRFLAPDGPRLRIEYPGNPLIQLISGGTLLGPTQPELWQPVSPAAISHQNGVAIHEIDPQLPGVPSQQFFGLTPTGPELPYVDLSQLSFDFNGVMTPFSDWGSARLHWIPRFDLTYFNLTVGTDWVVQNVPLPAINGIGAKLEIEVPFKLGLIGTPITEMLAGLSLSADPVSTAPPTNAAAAIGVRNYRIYSGEQNGEIAQAPASNPVGGTAVTSVRGKPGFPNREQGTNECAPSAILNSLQYLDMAFNLGLPKSELTIEKMKEAVKWTPEGAPVGENVSKAEWVASKRAYMRPNGMPITTDETPNIGVAMNALAKCYDVELRVQGHVVCVRAIVPLPDGRYLLVVAHDTDQGHIGGTVVEPWFYTPATGKIAAPGWLTNFRQFIIEFPDGH